MESYHLHKQYNKVLLSLSQAHIPHNLQLQMSIQHISLQMDSTQLSIPYIKGRKVCTQNDQSSSYRSIEDKYFHLDSHTNLQDIQGNGFCWNIIYTMKCCQHIDRNVEELLLLLQSNSSYIHIQDNTKVYLKNLKIILQVVMKYRFNNPQSFSNRSFNLMST